jgi:hypothetical protein
VIHLRLILSLLIFVPAFAMVAGFAWLDALTPGSPIPRMIIGGLIGVFFGLGFGGAFPRKLGEAVLGAKEKGEKGHPASVSDQHLADHGHAPKTSARRR